jgi:hypothetical protein
MQRNDFLLYFCDKLKRKVLSAVYCDGVLKSVSAVNRKMILPSLYSDNDRASLFPFSPPKEDTWVWSPQGVTNMHVQGRRDYLHLRY